MGRRHKGGSIETEKEGASELSPAPGTGLHHTDCFHLLFVVDQLPSCVLQGIMLVSISISKLCIPARVQMLIDLSRFNSAHIQCIS